MIPTMFSPPKATNLFLPRSVSELDKQLGSAEGQGPIQENFLALQTHLLSQWALPFRASAALHRAQSTRFEDV